MSPAPVFAKHMAHIFSEVERDNERDVFCEEVLNRACRNFGKFSVLRRSKNSKWVYNGDYEKRYFEVYINNQCICLKINTA